MLLSEIFSDNTTLGNAVIKDEKHFDYLGLTASDVDNLLCVFLDNEKYLDDIKDNVSMVITTEIISKLLENRNHGICIVENPRETFFCIHNYLVAQEYAKKERKKTIFGENCNISSLSSISQFDVKIGKNVLIEEFVVIRENTIIGDDVIIRSGSVIGGQGYEFKKVEGGILSVEHAGGVIIGNDVEIQYNSCIDKGLYKWDNTIIGDNVKIDNLVHVAHGVKIGKNSMIVANSGIGGRTRIGENTWIGFGSTIINGISIGDGARANIGAVVTKSIKDNESYTGNFAIKHTTFLRNLKSILDNE